jgi:hypothetical protein
MDPWRQRLTDGQGRKNKGRGVEDSLEKRRKKGSICNGLGRDWAILGLANPDLCVSVGEKAGGERGLVPRYVLPLSVARQAVLQHPVGTTGGRQQGMDRSLRPNCEYVHD